MEPRVEASWRAVDGVDVERQEVGKGDLLEESDQEERQAIADVPPGDAWHPAKLGEQIARPLDRARHELGEQGDEACEPHEAPLHLEPAPVYVDGVAHGLEGVKRDPDGEERLQVSGVTYARASKHRAEFSGRLHRMLAEIDCMVCPSMSNSAPAKLRDAAAVYTDAIWESLVPNDIFTMPFNFSGVPTLSVPCGFSADGLPLSVQFVGARLSEALLCRVGHAYEQATEWHTRHPSV